ncbi:MAG: acetyl-CoA carboxylase carboxyltransferase subunit beta [Alphaproteobacteria bacterium]|nr:MAG: acetyl-CoA carboxylase carboxyltransferase subunit beta [Alphaproteobacteria bacterium]
MNWMRDYVRPTLRSVFKRSGGGDTEEAKWHSCDNCGQMIYRKDFVTAQHVCSHCDHHHRIGPDERFPALFDGGNFQMISMPKGIDDPLKFRDKKKYADRLKDNRSKTKQPEAMSAAVGKISGHTCVAAVQNFAFMAGSLGVAAGDTFLIGAQRAIAENAPYIIFTAAGGARMQEGILSLMQMPRTTVAVEMLREAGLPYIVVLTDPTTGGVTASYAMLGDIQIAEPGALIGFAGPRVIEDTIREKLPDGFQRAEYLFEHGMVDMVVHRHELRDALAGIIMLLTNQPAPTPGNVPLLASQPAG